MPFFGVGGDRFRSNKEFTPGPGDYDPAKARGFKADPKSGFLTGDRFHELEREGKQRSKSRSVRDTLSGHTLSCGAPTHWSTSCFAEGLAPEVSPPRERRKAQIVDGRKFSWATQRIHDLEKELEQAKSKIKVCSFNLLCQVTM
jgi:hypothetical protein